MKNAMHMLCLNISHRLSQTVDTSKGSQLKHWTINNEQIAKILYCAEKLDDDSCLEIIKILNAVMNHPIHVSEET